MSLKRRKNLLIDGAVLDMAEDYCACAGTTVSQVFEDYLKSLTKGERLAESPIVARLVGGAIMGSGDPGTDTYRDYLYGLVIEGDYASIDDG